MKNKTFSDYTAKDIERLARRAIENPRYREEFQYVCDLHAKKLRTEAEQKRNGTYNKTMANYEQTELDLHIRKPKEEPNHHLLTHSKIPESMEMGRGKPIAPLNNPAIEELRQKARLYSKRWRYSLRHPT